MAAPVGAIAAIAGTVLQKLQGNKTNMEKQRDAIVENKSEGVEPNQDSNFAKNDGTTNATNGNANTDWNQSKAGKISGAISSALPDKGYLGVAKTGLDIWRAYKASDEELKEIYVSCPDDIIHKMGELNRIEFKYTPEAQEAFGSDGTGIDNDNHTGMSAQDLASNPLTASAVKETPNGYLAVDTKEMTMINTAVLTDICKRLEALEQKQGE